MLLLQGERCGAMTCKPNGRCTTSILRVLFHFIAVSIKEYAAPRSAIEGGWKPHCEWQEFTADMKVNCNPHA